MKGFQFIFQVEPEDRSVGIMSEGFSGWMEDGETWCELTDFRQRTITWYDNITGEPGKAPFNHTLVEAMLFACVEAYYQERAHEEDIPSGLDDDESYFADCDPENDPEYTGEM